MMLLTAIFGFLGIAALMILLLSLVWLGCLFEGWTDHCWGTLEMLAIAVCFFILAGVSSKIDDYVREDTEGQR